METISMYHKLETLCTKSHQSELSRAQTRSKQEQILKKMEKKRETLTEELRRLREQSPLEEKQIKELKENIDLIKNNIKEFRLKAEEEDKMMFEFNAIKESVLQELNQSQEPIGQCLMFLEFKKEKLKCSVCNMISTKTNPLKEVCVKKHLECSFCLEEQTKCDKCGLAKEIRDFEEGNNILLEIELIKEIMLQLNSQPLDCSVPRNTELEVLKAELSDKQKEIELLVQQNRFLNEKIKRFGADRPVKQELSQFDALYKPSTGEKHCLRTENNKIIELTVKNEEIVGVTRRNRIREKENFLFWVNNLQLCATSNSESKRWELRLFDGEQELDFRTTACSNIHDTFFKRGDNIYLGIGNSFVFHKITVENKKLNINKIGETSGTVRYLLESKHGIFLGTSKNELQIVKNNKIMTIAALNNVITCISLGEKYLSVICMSGRALQFALETYKVVTTIQLKGDNRARNLVVEDALIVRNGNKLIFYDWSGKILKQIFYNGKQFDQFYHTKHSTMITDDNGQIFVFSHKTLSLKAYSGMEIPYRYGTHY